MARQAYKFKIYTDKVVVIVTHPRGCLELIMEYILYSIGSWVNNETQMTAWKFSKEEQQFLR